MTSVGERQQRIEQVLSNLFLQLIFVTFWAFFFISLTMFFLGNPALWPLSISLITIFSLAGGATLSSPVDGSVILLTSKKWLYKRFHDWSLLSNTEQQLLIAILTISRSPQIKMYQKKQKQKEKQQQQQQQKPTYVHASFLHIWILRVISLYTLFYI